MTSGIHTLMEAQVPRKRKAKIERLSPTHDFRAALIQDVKVGLSQKPWWFPSKYRYDEEGSRLCERITETPQYYLRRAEIEILRERAEKIMKLVDPEEVVELGSGFSTKTKIIIEAMQRTTKCRVYTPFDICEDALHEAADSLTAEYDWLEVNGLLGDFDTDLPKLQRRGRRLIVFLGSSLGNIALKSERSTFLSNVAAAMLPGDCLMLGLDLVKDVSVMDAAYHDSEGLNSRFNLRVLHVINRELEGNFPLEDFKFVKSWDSKSSSMVSTLQAQSSAKVSIKALPLEVEFEEGDQITVAISHKFTQREIMEDITAAGLYLSAWYTDSSNLFGLLIATI